MGSRRTDLKMWMSPPYMLRGLGWSDEYKSAVARQAFTWVQVRVWS